MTIKRRSFFGMILAAVSTGVVAARDRGLRGTAALSRFRLKPRSIYLGEATLFHSEKILAPCEFEEEILGDGTQVTEATAWEPDGTEVKMSLHGGSKGRARSGALTVFFKEESDPEMMAQFKQKQRFSIRITPIPS